MQKREREWMTKEWRKRKKRGDGGVDESVREKRSKRGMEWKRGGVKGNRSTERVRRKRKRRMSERREKSVSG